MTSLTMHIHKVSKIQLDEISTMNETIWRTINFLDEEGKNIFSVTAFGENEANLKATVKQEVDL